MLQKTPQMGIPKLFQWYSGSSMCWLATTTQGITFSYESTLSTKIGSKLLKFLMLIKEKKIIFWSLQYASVCFGMLHFLWPELNHGNTSRPVEKGLCDWLRLNMIQQLWLSWKQWKSEWAFEQALRVCSTVFTSEPLKKCVIPLPLFLGLCWFRDINSQGMSIVTRGTTIQTACRHHPFAVLGPPATEQIDLKGGEKGTSIDNYSVVEVSKPNLEGNSYCYTVWKNKRT